MTSRRFFQPQGHNDYASVAHMHALLYLGTELTSSVVTVHLLDLYFDYIAVAPAISFCLTALAITHQALPEPEPLKGQKF